MGRRRNRVMHQIVKDCSEGVKDLTKSGKNTLNKVAQVGRSKPLLASHSRLEPIGMVLSLGATSSPMVIAVYPTHGRSKIGEFDRGIVATPPQENLSASMSLGNQQTTPLDVLAIPPSVVVPQSQVSEADEFLTSMPFLTRNEPTAAILPKVDLANALEHEGSILNKGEKGVWKAGLKPEKMAENDAPSTPQVTGPTPTMV